MKKITLFLGLILLSACDVCKNEKITLPLMPYDGAELRMDGYYYCELSPGTNHKHACCFYRNGVQLNLGGNYYATLQELDAHILKDYVQSSAIKNMQLHWAVYHITENKQIIVQYYSYLNCSTLVDVDEGVILNDTTFKITEQYRIDGSERLSVDRLYRFRRFSPKPDSTNQWVK